jgi:acetyl esterase
MIDATRESLPTAPSRQVLEFLRRRATGSPTVADIAKIRTQMRAECRELGGAPEQVFSVDRIDTSGTTSLLYRPTGEENTVLVWMHGGGWVIGDPLCYDPFVRSLAARSGSAILVPDYRLAPENPFPAAVDDIWATTSWAASAFDQVAVGGDSAGGNLAAVAALLARDAGLKLAFQLLVYPIVEYRVESDSYAAFRKRYRDFAGDAGFGDRACEEIALAWQLYAPDERSRADFRTSPFLASDLSGLAPALVITAEHDILTAEGVDYADRMRAAEVDVDLKTFRGLVHGFAHLLGAMDDAHVACELSARALDAAFRAPGLR